MKIEVKAAPAQANSHAQDSKPSARQAAIEAFNKGVQAQAAPMQQGQINQSQQLPVKNASQISPEEVSLVKPSKQLVQSDTSEEEHSESPSEATKKTEEDETLSTKYALLARKEKAIRRQVQEFKAQQDAWRNEQAKSEAAKQPAAQAASPDADLKGRLQEDLIGTLSELGYTPEQITNSMLNQEQKSSYVKALEAKLSTLEQRLGKAEKTYEEQQADQYQQSIKFIRSETQSLVNSDPEFETIKETGEVDKVVELIERTWKEDGLLLSVEDAAREIESDLVEQILKAASIGKIRQKLTPQEKKQVEQKQLDDSGSADKAENSKLKTLTNGIGAKRPLTAKERAIAAFKGQKVS